MTLDRTFLFVELSSILFYKAEKCVLCMYVCHTYCVLDVRLKCAFSMQSTKCVLKVHSQRASLTIRLNSASSIFPSTMCVHNVCSQCESTMNVLKVRPQCASLMCVLNVRLQCAS